jgi:hypothetical protein
MKEMTSVASTIMTDEEKIDVEKDMNSSKDSSRISTPPVSSGSVPPTDGTDSGPGFSQPSFSQKPQVSTANEHAQLISPSTDGRPESKIKDAKKRSKLSPEQRAKIQELEKERRKAMEARIAMLTAKLIDRLRPYVEAKKPGDKDDAETLAFEAKMRREAEDLKLESFGVELLQAIGTVYMMKASSFMKSKKFLGM